MSAARALTIRQFDRLALDLPLILQVASEHTRQVRFSASSGVRGEMIRGRAADLSSGGLGAISRWFLPRNCEATVRINARNDADDGSEGALLLQHRVKVRRVSHLDDGAMYALGLAFIDPDADLERQIAEVEQYVASQHDTGRDGEDDDRGGQCDVRE